MLEDRNQAGIILSTKLGKYKQDPHIVVVGIPRGGVVVAFHIANRLHVPLSVVNIKKLSSPTNPELAIGAVASDGITYLDWDLIHRLQINGDALQEELERKKTELAVRAHLFQTQKNTIDIAGKKVVLVDDGIATGATVYAAVEYLKHKKVSKIILVTPVIARDTYVKLKSKVETIIAIEISQSFSAVGQFYKNFSQVSDKEVLKILSENRYKLTNNKNQ